MTNNGVITTSIDLNTDATTTIFAPSTDATPQRIEVPNPGGTAAFDVEATDGTDTLVLASSGAGGDVSITEETPLTDPWSLQVDVTTVEGSASTTTAFVFVGE